MLHILFKCRSCGKQLMREDADAGLQVNCLTCGSSITVPKNALIYTCPHSNCSQPVKIDIALQGDGLHCPSCNKSIMLPIQRADLIIFLCKRCEKIVEIPVSEAGKLLACPTCNEWIRGPELKEIANAAAGAIGTGPASPLATGYAAVTSVDQILRILVVDDNPTDQHLVAKHLEQIAFWKHRIEIDFVMNGEEAIAKLREKNFALVVLDWNLPVLGQGEVLRRLRNAGSRIPVVVISGVEQHHLAEKLAAIKGTYLSKDTMSPANFHVAICQALALVELKVAHFF